MTALTIRVRFAERAYLRARYRPLAELIELARRLGGDTPDEDAVKRARHLLDEGPFGHATLSALRSRLGALLSGEASPSSSWARGGDAAVWKVVRGLREGRLTHHVHLDGGRDTFQCELASHVSGSVAPLVSDIEVGWRSPFLKDGLWLVDAPGTGVANDPFVEACRVQVRRARSVLLVVDRSGIDEASAAVMRDSGFLHRLIGGVRTDRRAHLLVAISNLDLPVADLVRAQGGKRRRWTDHLREMQAEAIRVVRGQLAAELGRLSGKSAEASSVQAETVRIVPVLAVEHQNLYLGDAGDPARIGDPEDSNIPSLRRHLRRMAADQTSEGER